MKSSAFFARSWVAATAALVVAGTVQAESSVDYATMQSALEAAYGSGACQNTQTTDSDTSTQSDGSQVAYQSTSYKTTCAEAGRRTASLDFTQMDGEEAMSGTLTVSFVNNWELYADFAFSVCTLDTSSGESCDCEICEVTTSDTRRLVGATVSCSSPPANDNPFSAGRCVGITDMASGASGGDSGAINAGDAFGVTFESLASNLRSAFANSCSSSTASLSCNAADGRSSSLSAENGALSQLKLSQQGQFALEIDFAASSCVAFRSGNDCGDCELCTDFRGNLGVLANCSNTPPSEFSNVTFSGVCNSIVDLAQDGHPSPTAYDKIAFDVASAFSASSCDANPANVTSNTTNGVLTQYELSCSGVGNTALLIGLEGEAQELSITANDKWFLSVDFSMHTCQVEVFDSSNEGTQSSCSRCELCRPADGSYGVMVSGCPTESASLPFSATECTTYMNLAKASFTGEASSDATGRNSFEAISSDIKSVFSADTCVEQPGYLNCSHPDGRSVSLVGAPDTDGVLEPTELRVYNKGMYVIHVDFNTSDCSVELVSGTCDCSYCANEEGKFGITSHCGESQTEYDLLKTGECVQISDISEGRVMGGDEEADKEMTKPPFYRLVTELEGAFSEQYCTKGSADESYKVQLPNGTYVFKTRIFLEMNCSLNGRTSYVNKTDDDGVEILGRLVITSESDPNAKVSLDFEANTCSAEVDGAPCSNCTACKYNDDKDYGISAYCPNAGADSLFSGGSGTCVPIVEAAGGDATTSSNGTSGNGTTPTDNDAADGDSTEGGEEDPNNPDSEGPTDADGTDSGESEGDGNSTTPTDNYAADGDSTEGGEEDPSNPDSEGPSDTDGTDNGESDGEGSGGGGADVDDEWTGDSSGSGSGSDGTPEETGGPATTSRTEFSRYSRFVLLLASLPVVVATL